MSRKLLYFVFFFSFFVNFINADAFTFSNYTWTKELPVTILEYADPTRPPYLTYNADTVFIRGFDGATNTWIDSSTSAIDTDASGNYFYQLRAGAFVKTQKISLVK